MGLREAIFAADDRVSEPVEVPEWGVTVEVAGMSGAERANFLSNYSNEDGTVNWESLYPSLLIHTVQDPDTHDKVFEPGDETYINEKSGAALERVAKVALRLSGLDRSQEEEAGKSS